MYILSNQRSCPEFRHEKSIFLGHQCPIDLCLSCYDFGHGHVQLFQDMGLLGEV